VSLGQPLLYRRRQQIGGVSIDRVKGHARFRQIQRL
jgi:hypothetical protein